MSRSTLLVVPQMAAKWLDNRFLTGGVILERKRCSKEAGWGKGLA